MNKQKYPNIFRPLKIGPVAAKNRIEIAPAIPILATEDGFVTEALIAYTQELARGGAGIVTIGDSCVEMLYAHEHPNQINLGDYRVVPGLYRLVESIHRHGAVASIEINHGGRFTPPIMLNGRSPIGPSAIPSDAHEQFEGDASRRPIPVHAMTHDEINRVIGEFATAVEHCAQSGFKMVMLHGGHGHLLAQFFSPLANKRNDNYGGSFENRIRFIMEVLTAVRARVGNSIAIQYRISGDELVDEGVHFDEIVKFVQAIESKIDLVHVSMGNICKGSTAPYMIQPTYIPRGVNAKWAVELKKHINIPVTAVGSITMEMAEELLTDDKVDMVGMIRNILADTQIVNKYRRGEEKTVRPCIRCDSCTQNTSRFYPVICAINPMLGREVEFTEIVPAAKIKKVAVAGGGPAGMQAALTAAQRGHSVTLFEKSGELGGNLILGAAHGFKADMKKYLDWLCAQVHENDSVDLRMNTEATSELLCKEQYDAVLVAIGTTPFIPKVPGVEKAILAGDIHEKISEIGKDIVIVGGGLTGLETALELAQQGKNVKVIDMLPRQCFGQDCNNIAKIALFNLLEEANVTFTGDVKLECVDDSGATVINRDWERYHIAADTVILSTGYISKTDEANSFLDVAKDVFFIGDCGNVSNLKTAIHQGFNYAYEL
jgi:2,4-dienoyl-CoA reductase-like NADH-dependent reductase (Old Yellow Enzyme family)/thioredoxin reductase